MRTFPTRPEGKKNGKYDRNPKIEKGDNPGEIRTTVSLETSPVFSRNIPHLFSMG
jgi:hypothetical protein